MKIFILWDMEGTSGLFMREQTWFSRRPFVPKSRRRGSGYRSTT